MTDSGWISSVQEQELFLSLLMELLSTLWMELLSTDTGIALWMELLSTEIGIAGIPRTQETKGRLWGQDRVKWNTEDPVPEDLSEGPTAEWRISERQLLC